MLANPKIRKSNLHDAIIQKSDNVITVLDTYVLTNTPVVKETIQELSNDKDVQKGFNLVSFRDLHKYIMNQIFHQFIYRILRLK